MFQLLTHLAYFAVVILLVTRVPPGFLGSLEGAGNSIFIVGVLGIWRYSWASLNFIRAVYFRRVVYPRKKRRMHRAFHAEGQRSHAYFLVTSYMVEPKVSLPVYRAAFEAAANNPDGATIVASVVHGADERLIRKIYDTMPRDMGSVKLILDRIKANGKRDALARTLEILQRHNPTHRDILVFVDGDTMVPADIATQSAPMFMDPEVGALTTDEGVMLEKQNLFRDWFVLRFNQRQVMMCSMGLSDRVLTLTGRMSVFRASLACDPGFIEQVRNDYLEHWRLGTVKFVTGDDKSTWFWLLKHGYKMVYLPDVRSWSYETQPRPGFFDSSQVLMTRWLGNMMRTNGRAIRLSPRTIGYFTWWSILDQRVSMYTTLVGPITVTLAAILYSWMVIPLYLAWVLFTRYLFCVVIALFRGTWFPVTHPPILYFGQIAGAAVKTYVLARLDKQKWTRQSADDKMAVPLDAKLRARESALHHVFTLIWLTLAVMFLTKV